jgi:hypothetical protein
MNRERVEQTEFWSIKLERTFLGIQKQEILGTNLIFLKRRKTRRLNFERKLGMWWWLLVLVLIKG